MTEGFRQTGINVIGAVPWGTHFCQFYQTKQDLLDTLIPYFKTGLENDEFCMWITAEPLSAEEAREAMHRAMPDFSDRLAKGQIEILSHIDWYLKGGSFDQQRVLNGWVEKLNTALAKGYAGLRLTGNTFWLEKRDWQSFTDYEAAVNNVIGQYRMLALCTYSLDKCNAIEVMDVIRNHEFALIRREGKWELIENAIHKQAKQALLESEKKYRQLVESLHEGVGIVDKNLCVTFVNSHMSEMLGYTADEVLGKSFFDFIDESDQQAARQAIARRIQGVSDAVEFALHRKDGRPLHVLISATPLSDDQGNFSGFVAGVVDITERMRAEKAIRESQEKLQAAFASITEAIFIADAKGRLIDFNDEFVRYHRFKNRDECSRTISDCPKYLDVWFPDGRPAPLEEWAMSRALRGEIASNVEYRLRRRETGETWWGSYSFAPIKDEDGIIVGAIVAGREITELKRMENALKRSEERLDMAQKAANTGVWDWDIATGQIIWSDKMFTLFGLDPMKTTASLAAWEKVLHLDDLEIARLRIAQALKQHSILDSDYRVVMTDGQIRWIHAAGEGIYDENGEPLRLIGTCIDITKRKKAEEELGETRDYLDNLLNYANAPIIVWDTEFRITRFNRAFETLTGYTAKEVLGKEPAILFPAQTREESLNHIRRTASGERWEVIEIPIMRKDGSVRTVLWNSATLFSPDGKTVVSTIAQGQDITERKLMEEALGQALLRYRTVADNTYDFEFWINPEGRFLYASPSCHRIYGRTPSEFLDDPGLRRRTIHPDDIATFDRHVTAEGKQLKDEVEYRIIHSDGTCHWIAHICQPVFDETGRYLGIRGSNRDITERKQNEEALKASETRYRRLFEASKDGILILDWETGQIVDVNPFIIELLGYSHEELIGKKLWELGAFKDIAASKAAFAKLKIKGHIRYEDLPLEKKNGLRSEVEFVSNVYEVDHTKVMQCNIRDITERKQAEENLRQSEDLLKRAQEIAHIGSWELDLLKDRLYWSDEVYRIFGLWPQEFEATYEAFLDAVHPEDRAAVDKAYSGSLRDGKNGYEIEHRVVMKSSGEVRFVLEKCEHIRDESGKVIRSTGMVQDITERRQAELLEHIGNIGSWKWDITTGGLEWSDEVYSIFGLEPGQFQGTREVFLSYVHPDDSKKLEAAINEVLHNNKEEYNIEFRIVRSNGSIRVVNEKGRVYLNRKGKTVRAVGTIQDITERKTVEDRLKNLSRRLVDIQEQERRGIARELHDGLAQSLATVRILLDRGTKPASDMRPIINEARDVVQDVIDQVREMSLNLRPSMLDDLGLIPALQWHFEQVTSRTGVKINFKHSGLKLAESKGLTTEVRTAVYRIIQEAISNAIRHAQADQVNVSIRIRDNTLHLFVEDHGKGFDIDAMPDISSGLSTMQERAYLCGGSLVINSASGAGTRISAEIPIQEGSLK